MRCESCGIPIDTARSHATEGFCDVCDAMIRSVAAQPNLYREEILFHVQNTALAIRKMELLQ